MTPLEEQLDLDRSLSQYEIMKMSASSTSETPWTIHVTPTLFSAGLNSDPSIQSQLFNDDNRKNVYAKLVEKLNLGVTHELLSTLQAKISDNMSESVEYQEFYSLLSQYFNAYEIEQIYNAFDIDGDGSLSSEEVQAGLALLL